MTAQSLASRRRPAKPFALHPDRLFPADPVTRDIARRLYATVAGLPIVSPHGHTDPRWFAEDEPFPDPARLFIVPDHYVYRMLYSQGIALEDGGRAAASTAARSRPDPRKIWRLLRRELPPVPRHAVAAVAEPCLHDVFGIDEQPSADNADRLYDIIAECLARPEFRPRALFERFNIEVLATTESPLDDLRHHRAIRASGWKGRVITAFRPDPVVDPDFPGFAAQPRRARPRSPGATPPPGKATSTRWPTAAPISRRWARPRPTMAIPPPAPPISPPHEAEALFDRVKGGRRRAEDAELFRAQMLTEMARMSLEDGLVMQIHPGSRPRPQSVDLQDLRQGQGVPTSRARPTMSRR